MPSIKSFNTSGTPPDLYEYLGIPLDLKKQLYTHEMNMILPTQTTDKEYFNQNHEIPTRRPHLP